MSEQNLQWGSYEWTASSNALHCLVKEAVSAALISPTYLEVIQDAVSAAFTTPHTWKLARFSFLIHDLVHAVLPITISQALMACKQNIDSMVDSTFSQNCHQTFPPDTFASLDRRICGCILQQLHAAITDSPQLIKQAPEANKLPLQEDATTAARR